MVADHIRIRDLKVVVALFETGNMTHAAKRLGISESAVSKQLNKIELRVQVRLFERDNGGVEATDSCRSFVMHAKDSIQSFQQAVHEAHQAKHGELHKLRIGVSALLPARWIELVQSIELRTYRNLTIEVISAYSMELLAQLENHRLDLVLITSPPKNASIATHCVMDSSFMIVFRDSHPLAQKTSTNLKEVSQYPWIFFHREVHPPLHDLILRSVAEEGAPARIAHEISRADQVAPLLVNQSILAWLGPAGADSIVGNGLRRIPLVDPRFRLETHLVARSNSKSKLVSEYFRSFVKRVEEESAPVQLTLPIAEMPSENVLRSM